MPLATLPSGIRLAYESRGRGETLLLIAGLGRDRRMWDGQVPALSERLRVVTFDNRGVGESEKPAGPYTAAQMAADAAGLLDVLEVESAHVAGASLGGSFLKVHGVYIGFRMEFHVDDRETLVTAPVESISRAEQVAVAS